MNTRRGVAITGVGAVTPLGHGAEHTWRAVRAGRSGIARITGIDVHDLPVQIGGEIREFDPHAWIAVRDAKRLDPHAWYAVAAAEEAMAQALGRERRGPAATDAPADWVDPWRFGVIVGTGSGAVTLMQEATRTLDRRGPRHVPPGVVVSGGADAAAAYISQRYAARGTSMGIGATCASSAVAIGEAARAIRHGYLDAVLVIGAEHCITRVNLAANATIGALAAGFTDAPTRASRPFDRDRSGFVMSAGAAALLLEAEPHAAARGARRLGEVLGYGSTSDAYHATAPHPDGAGAAAAIRQALDDAGLGQGDIDHINAHGTSTRMNDETEARAIHTVFGARAVEIPVSATKSTTGHLIGAAGALEAILSLQTLRDGVMPPTLNLDHADAQGLDIVDAPRPARLGTVLSHSFGFGGHNAALILA